MRILDRYIGRQILSGTLFAILLLSLLLVIGNLFKEIRPLLVEVGAPLWAVGDFLLSVLPVSLIFTIPWAFLSAVLLVFGRLSSDSELNAFRASGVSLLRISAPAIVLSILFSALCLWLNIKVAPAAQAHVRDIITRTIIKDPRTLLRSGADQSRFKNLKIDSESNDGDIFHDFHVFAMDLNDEGNVGAYIHADTAETVLDQENKQIRLRLTGVYSDGNDAKGDEFTMLSGDLEWMVVDYSDDRRHKPKPSAMSNAEIEAFLASRPNLPIRFQAVFRAEQMRRYTSSFACLAFALIGVPLGIKGRRRDTSTGIVISLGIGAAYFIASSMLEGKGETQWMLWIPNMVCFLVGIILFRRARFR